MMECNTCKHNGNQMLYPSGCTGCGDGEYLNYEPMTNKPQSDMPEQKDEAILNARIGDSDE